MHFDEFDVLRIGTWLTFFVQLWKGMTQVRTDNGADALRAVVLARELMMLVCEDVTIFPIKRSLCSFRYAEE